MGTGFAIGNPGEPVEYIVTNGHVVQYGLRMSPRSMMPCKYLRKAFKCIISAAENDYVTGGGGLLFLAVQ